MDPLSDVIALLRPSTAISKPITGRARWAVRYAAHNAPGFTIILKGECWISFDRQEPVKFQKGDFVLLPASPAFTLSSHPNVECEPRDPMDTPVRHGEQEGDADFELLGGTFRIEQVNAPLLLSLLPCVIHIPVLEGRTGKLNSIIELIMDECGSEEPGKKIILQRMLEVLLIEALRWQGIAHDDVRAGLLNGMQDPGLARVLRAVHADVRANWTVAGLAKVAGLSRSAFAARFGEVPLRPDRVSRPLANGAGKRRADPWREDARQYCRRDRLQIRERFQHSVPETAGLLAREIRAKRRRRRGCLRQDRVLRYGCVQQAGNRHGRVDGPPGVANRNRAARRLLHACDGYSVRPG